MLKKSGLALCSLAMLILAAPAAWADVLPSRRIERAPEAAPVAQRLADVGVPLHDAMAQASAMSADDAAFFSEDADRVQVVAGLWAEEWLFGILGLTIVGWAAFVIGDGSKR